MTFNQFDLTASLQQYLSDKTGIRTDILYDDYKFPTGRPLITIEQMQNNYEYNVKRKDAVEVIYRWQIGFHASGIFERLQEQETISDLLTFGEVPYFDFEKSADNPAGFFNLTLNDVMPMPSEDVTDHSRKHTVYFDVELATFKRKRRG